MPFALSGQLCSIFPSPRHSAQSTIQFFGIVCRWRVCQRNLLQLSNICMQDSRSRVRSYSNLLLHHITVGGVHHSWSLTLFIPTLSLDWLWQWSYLHVSIAALMFVQTGNRDLEHAANVVLLNKNPCKLDIFLNRVNHGICMLPDVFCTFRV